MDVLKPGEHGSTFGGNPLACAVARTALKVLLEENLVENAAQMGARLMEGLSQIHNPLIREIRGRGLMVGIEFDPAAGGARQYSQKLKERGLLCKETHEHILRIAPPLVIDTETIDWAVEQFKVVL
jgi:ornithine--oxo-acid transaminase